jgi:transcriptional regulator with XRE-family HTH domain
MKPLKTLERRLGERIARQRQLVGLTQAELAEKVEVQPETISRIENGKRGLSLRLMVLLAESLDLALHELLHIPPTDTPKDLATERLLWFAKRSSLEEIELIMNIGSAVVAHTRKCSGQATAEKAIQISEK